MKKIIISLVLIAIGISAYAQSPHRFVNLTPAYPIAIGETATDSLTYTNNGIYVQDIIQDNLPVYEIGQIFDQTVDYTQDGNGFYVKSDSLDSDNITFSISVDSLPTGPIEFNSKTGRFKYFPDAGDYRTFNVTFSATNGTDTVSEVVKFVIRPQVVPEQYALNNQGLMPYSEEYTLIASRDLGSRLFNGTQRNVHSYSISGKDITFDNNFQNKVWGLSGREDIAELNIYAERLIIRSALMFPQTDVTIYAKEIIFEDQDGEIASINTTPSYMSIRTAGVGVNGANAGNIHLYVRDLKGNGALRFILNGGNGQSTSRIGTPGNGGNGGVVYSNLDIQSYCDFARGSCGVRYDADNTSPDYYGAIVGSGAIGMQGHFEKENAPYKFLHPNYIAPVIRHVTDAYINNFIQYSKETCHEYQQLIEEYFAAQSCDTCESEEDMELSSNLTEFNGLLSGLEMGLDYFGNSIGWVPLLSFEVMLANYQNEVDRAIPTLYLYYWLTKVDRTLEEWTAAKLMLAEQTKAEIDANRNMINSLVAEIPILLDNIDEIEAKIAEVNIKIDQIEAQLLKKAKKKLKKKALIKKAAQTCRAIASVAQFCGPYGAAVAGVLNTAAGVAEVATNTASNITSNVAYAAGQLNVDANIESPDFTSFFPKVDTASYNILDMLSNVRSTLSGLSLDELASNGNYLQQTDATIKNQIAPLISTVGTVREALKKNTVSSEEVKALFAKLCAESPEWNQLQTELKDLEEKKKKLREQIETIYQAIPALLSEVRSDMIALDAFRNDAFENNSKRDLHAMQYLEKMEQRAKNRLIKYHYYLRKAYEYRMLKPYEGEYNLVGMFERFETLASTISYDSLIDLSNYAALASVFDDVVSGIIEEIIDEYSDNYPEQSAPITIVIPREQLDVINQNDNLMLNFYEMGIFSPDEENVRIVDLSVYHIETHTEGNVGYTGYMDLNMTHQGISRFRKDGQIYWFDHISRSTTNPHTWGVRYDAVSQEITPIQPSYASTSLLYSVLGTSGAGNMMLFSRPSAWADITLSKKVHSSGGARIIVDSLVLKLQYDFMRRPNTIRNIDITTNDGLLPYISCSDADINGRSNGNGNLNRSYAVSSSPLTFTAIDQYGTYHFVNWTNRAGDTVSSTADLTVNRTTDQFYRANYERRVPILEVPDTIYVSHSGGVYTVNVSNIGSGDIEMDWYVDDSVSTWVHLNGVTEGFDNGSFSFVCETNESEIERVDSIEIFAPETDIMSKVIYIIQTDSSWFSVSANVEPAESGSVSGTGFYASGDTATVIAVPAADCRFVSWVRNGSVVSSEPIYSFVVNEDVLLTANFDCNNVSVESAEDIPVRIYPNPAANQVTVEGNGLMFVRVYSLLGSEKSYYSLDGQTCTSINLSTLPDGVYIFAVGTADGIIYKKVIKTGR